MADWLEEHFDLLYILMLFWLSLGAAMDGNTHAQEGGIETFFTFEHVVAYTAAAAIAILFSTFLYQRYRQGMGLREAIPDGYQFTVYSIPLFFIGAFGDMLWHTFFGLEVKATEIMSPPHLAILSFGIFIASGPLRKAWYHGAGRSWKKQFYLLSSAGFILWIINYGLLPLHPFVEPYAASWHPQSAEGLAVILGVAGLFVNVLIVMAFIYLLMERFDILPGGFTYLVGLYSLLMIYVSESLVFLPAALLFGVTADILRYVLKPSRERAIQYRLFAFLVPVIYVSLYFITISLTGSIPWSTHTWAGTIVFSGIGGVLMSHVAYPSRRMAQEAQ